MKLSLEGQIAIVTGGSKGIGRAIAVAFAEAGADVALAARGEEDLKLAAKEVEATGRRALPVVTDVSDPEAVKRLVDETVRELGTVDILVNNAGAAPFMSSVDEMRLDGFDKYFRINFHSAMYATKAVAPVLFEKRSGCVLNMASVGGMHASPGLPYYGPAKAALINLTKLTAREWGPMGIRVNAIAPGWIDTPMNESLRQVPGFTENTEAAIPLGRWGRPEDVASAALFLCSPEASWITGSVLVIDGGQSVGMLSEG